MLQTRWSASFKHKNCELQPLKALAVNVSPDNKLYCTYRYAWSGKLANTNSIHLNCCFDEKGKQSFQVCGDFWQSLCSIHTMQQSLWLENLLGIPDQSGKDTENRKCAGSGNEHSDSGRLSIAALKTRQSGTAFRPAVNASVRSLGTARRRGRPARMWLRWTIHTTPCKGIFCR